MNRHKRAKPAVITGFGPFPGVPDNPTATLVANLQDHGGANFENCKFDVLPVTYAESETAIEGIFADPPAILMMTGYSSQARAITLETGADDCRDPDLPDASGHAGPIAATEPSRIDNRAVDFAALEAALTRNGIACALSGDAGRYVCNHAYYGALRRAAAAIPRCRTIFVHIPAVTGTPLATRSAGSLTLAAMARALSILVEGLRSPEDDERHSRLVQAGHEKPLAQ